MGHDRVFPDSFSRIHPEFRTPHVSVLLSGGLIALMAVSLPLAQVAAATDLMFLLLFLQVNYSAIVIRREYGDELDYGYLMPLFPYVPIVGILTKFGLALYSSTTARSRGSSRSHGSSRASGSFSPTHVDEFAKPKSNAKCV